jgi:hypothetical protein
MAVICRFYFLSLHQHLLSGSPPEYFSIPQNNFCNKLSFENAKIFPQKKVSF